MKLFDRFNTSSSEWEKTYVLRGGRSNLAREFKTFIIFCNFMVRVGLWGVCIVLNPDLCVCVFVSVCLWLWGWLDFHRSKHHMSGGLLCQHGHLYSAVGKLHLRLLYDLLHWDTVQWPWVLILVIHVCCGMVYRGRTESSQCKALFRKNLICAIRVLNMIMKVIVKKLSKFFFVFVTGETVYLINIQRSR